MLASRLTMSTVVFGAAGFLGQHVVKLLNDSRRNVLAAVRPGATHPFAEWGVPTCEVDLRKVQQVHDALRTADSVIFCAGRTFVRGMPTAEYELQNVNLVRSFIEALENRSDIRVVFTSSMSAIAGSRLPHSFTGTEDRSLACTDRLNPYDSAKVDCERLALAAAARGRNIVVLNPGYMLGPIASRQSGLSTTFLVEWFCLQASPFCINGGQSYCDVRDVAAAHVAALEHGQPGSRYVVGGFNLRTTDFYDELAQVTGISGPFRIPPLTAWVGAAIRDAIQCLMPSRLKYHVHRDFVRSLALFYFADSRRAEQDLSYQTRPIQNTLLQTIQSLYEYGQLPTDSFRFVTTMTPENSNRVLMLKQLADKSSYRQFLLKRFDDIYQICEQNVDLREALDQSLRLSVFHARRGRFEFSDSEHKLDLIALIDFVRLGILLARVTYINL
ncbi:MAG: NAD-dependent epimerase/dehydratase family protein [Fuerstiella sp.]|nr:NAD-dependent epimerase/dehydratase family protein [Fuerstiella sp.]